MSAVALASTLQKRSNNQEVLLRRGDEVMMMMKMMKFSYHSHCYPSQCVSTGEQVEESEAT